MQVRTLEVFGTSVDEIKNFEYRCLGEVRILGALKHSCIVEIYGHQISSKWVPSCDGNPDRRILQSAILLEHIKGGSLKVIHALVSQSHLLLSLCKSWSSHRLDSLNNF